MTSQGTAHGRFQRAIRDRHLRRASTAARELGHVNLADALALTVLQASSIETDVPLGLVSVKEKVGERDARWRRD